MQSTKVSLLLFKISAMPDLINFRVNSPLIAFTFLLHFSAKDEVKLAFLGYTRQNNIF